MVRRGFTARKFEAAPEAGCLPANRPASGALLLTLPQAAQRLGLSVHTLQSWRWRYRAGLPLAPAAAELAAAMVTVGRAVRVSEDLLDRWLSHRRSEQRGTPRPGVGELRAEVTHLAARLEATGHRLAARLVSLAAEAMQ